ncbi:MAG: hypothetical protein GC181_04295 [Bacteroidetes bacterium]|nr:hypothetical protein [Bacteroidota bacterium]
MKKSLRIILPILSFLFFTTYHVSAQTSDHKVVYYAQKSGTSQLKTNQNLKYPVTLPAAATLYLQKNSEGKIIVIKGPIKLTKKLVDQKFEEEVGMSSTYFKYVLKKMSHHEEDAQHSFGGVSRGEEFLKGIFPINRTQLIFDSIHFCWYSQPGLQHYYFNLLDERGNTVFKISTPDTCFTLYHEFMSLPKDAEYSWFISDAQFGDGLVQKFYLSDKDSSKVFREREKVELVKLKSDSSFLPEYLGLLLSQNRLQDLWEITGALSEYTEFQPMINAIREELMSGSN